MSSTLPQYTRFPNPAHTSDESEHLLPRDGQSTRPWYATLFGSRSQAVDVADAPSGTLSSSDDVSSIPDWYLSAMIATAQHNGREAARREIAAQETAMRSGVSYVRTGPSDLELALRMPDADVRMAAIMKARNGHGGESSFCADLCIFVFNGVCWAIFFGTIFAGVFYLFHGLSFVIHWLMSLLG